MHYYNWEITQQGLICTYSSKAPLLHMILFTLGCNFYQATTKDGMPNFFTQGASSGLSWSWKTRLSRCHRISCNHWLKGLLLLNPMRLDRLEEKSKNLQMHFLRLRLQKSWLRANSEAGWEYLSCIQDVIEKI